MFAVVGKLRLRQSVGLVIGVRRGLALGIGDGFQKAICVVDVCRPLPFRSDFLGLSASLVILEGCGVVLRVGQRQQVASLVIGKACDSPLCIGLAGYPAQLVVAVSCLVAVGVGSGG